MPVTAPSKPKQNWKRRRQKAAQRAAKRETLTARIQATPEFELLRGCGWDVTSRDMRHCEPPTRSTNGTGARLNKVNVWHQPYETGPKGEIVRNVTPVNTAAWLWWLSIPDDAQDVLCDLSAKCSDKSRVTSTVVVPETKELLSKSLQLAAAEKDDPRQWGKVAK